MEKAPAAAVVHRSGWWPPGRIHCRLHGDREAMPPPDLADAVVAGWADHLRRHPQDYDGRILHLRSCQELDGDLHLDLMPMRFALLAARRWAGLTALQRARIPGPLGLSTIPLGSDGRVVVARRSHAVSIAQGSLFFFGGFGEPPRNGEVPDISGEAQRELREELGDTFGVRRFGMLGLGEYPAGQLNAVFLAELDERAETLVARAASATDAHEWDRLWTFEPEEVMRLSAPALGAARTAFAFDLGRWLLARHLGLLPPQDLPPMEHRS